MAISKADADRMCGDRDRFVARLGPGRRFWPRALVDEMKAAGWRWRPHAGQWFMVYDGRASDRAVFRFRDLRHIAIRKETRR